jgi:nucleoside-diphosphate-sugar epimerase
MADIPSQARFVLTGPSGWIGQAMLGVLARSWGGRLDGRVQAFGSRARSMELPWGERLEVRPLAEIAPDDLTGTHVIHLAYLTKEQADLLGERAFMDANLAIDDALLAALRHAEPASLFAASSGAAALAAQGRDLHPYGMAKLRQEARFLEWGRLAGVPVIAGRIFNIAGPYINKLRSYAISDIALQASETGRIRVTAGVPVFRSYLHVEDLCELVVAAGLQAAERCEPVDLCGGEIVEMADLAALVAEAFGNSPQILRGPVDYSRPSVYLGDYTQTRVLAMEVGVALSPLAVQVADTIAWLSSAALAPAHETIGIS